MDIEDNIPPLYKELEIISKQKWSKQKKEAKRTRVRLLLLKKGIIMIESKSTSGVQSKRKPRRPRQNQSKLPLIYLLTISNILTQELLITPTSIGIIPDLKEQESAFRPGLVVTSHRHENKDTNMAEADLLVKREPTQVKDILMENSLSEILLSKKMSKVDQQKKVDSDSLNIPLVYQTNTLNNLKQSL